MSILLTSTGLPLLSGGLPVLTSAAAATAPAQFGTGDWSVADPGTDGDVTLTISTLPSDGGSAITALQYTTDSGSNWANLTGTGTGARTLTVQSDGVTAFTNGVSYTFAVRAVNAVGNGTSSATKSVTPTASGADIVTRFGDQTNAGEGGITVTGTSISTASAGNTNYWQIVGTLLTPTSTGLSAGLVDTRLTLNNSEIVDISITTGAQSIANQSEWNTARAALSASGGDHFLFRALGGTTRYTWSWSFNQMQEFTSTVTFESSDATDKAYFDAWQPGASKDIGNCLFQSLVFRRLQSESTGATGGNKNGVVASDGVSTGFVTRDMTFDDCTFESDTTGYDDGTFTAGTFPNEIASFKLYRFENWAITNCISRNVVVHTDLNGPFTGLTITGCTLTNHWSDFIYINTRDANLTSDITIRNNKFYLYEGTYNPGQTPSEEYRHSDIVQIDTQGGGSIADFTFEGNICFLGDNAEVDRWQGQIFLLQNFNSQNNFELIDWTVRGNVLYGDAVWGFGTTGGNGYPLLVNCVLQGNTIIMPLNSISSAAERPALRVTAAGGIFAQNIFAGQGRPGVADFATTYIHNNGTSTEVDGHAIEDDSAYAALTVNSSSSYDSAFNNGGVYNPTTPAEALTAVRYKSGGAGDQTTNATYEAGSAGAVGTTSANGFWDFDTGAVVSANVQTYTGKPGAFANTYWSVATGGSSGEIDITISTLPPTNGNALTDIEYSTDGGTTFASLGTTSTGTHTITNQGSGSPLVSSTTYNLKLRAVNSAGTGSRSGYRKQAAAA